MKTKKLLSNLINELSLKTLTNSSSTIRIPFTPTEGNNPNAFNSIDEAQELNGLYCHPKGLKKFNGDKPDKLRKTILFRKYHISSRISKDQVKTTHSFLNQTAQNNSKKKSKTIQNSTSFQPLSSLSPLISINQMEFKNSIAAVKKLKKNKLICSAVNSIFTQCQVESYQHQIKEYSDKYIPIDTMQLPRISPIYKSQKERNDDDQKKSRADGFSRDSYFANKFYFSFSSGFSRSKPFSRAQASLTPILNDDAMFLIGGVNSEKLIDIWKCELRFIKEIDYKLQWAKMNIKGDDALPRMGHSACLYNNKIYIYGGKTDRDLPFSREDLLSYNLKTNEIKDEHCFKKSCSIWRRNHTANVIAGHMIVLGGISDKEELISEVNVLDLNIFRWSYLTMEKGYHAPPVAYHSSCVIIPCEKLYNSQMGLYRSPDNPRISILKIKFEGLYYFGGKNKRGESVSDLRVIRLGKKIPDLILLKCGGIPPLPRYSCTLTFHEPFELLIVYGGKNDKNSQGVFNDIHVMNVFDLNWIKITLFGIPSNPRAEHSACVIEKALIIFGGSNAEGYLSADLFLINLDYFSNKKLAEDYGLK